MLARFLPPGTSRVVINTLGYMGIADEELDAAKQANRGIDINLDSAWPLLVPSVVFYDVDPRLYRAHARELLRRYVCNDDTRLATQSEVLLVLSAQSLKAPLVQQYAALYETLFFEIFQTRVDGEPVREPWPHASDELLHTMRRKLRVGNRTLNGDQKQSG